MDTKAHIPTEVYEACLGHIQRALDNPTNPAALALGRNYLKTLKGYSPVELAKANEEEHRHHGQH